MILELPKKFDFPYTEIVGGELIIHQVLRYEDLMYELTYCLKKKRCVYCGKKLKINNSTLDHRYPRDTGGISITNNLFPCCASCNSDKGNFTHEEYLILKNLSKEERKAFKKKIQKINQRMMKKIGYKLPKKWVIYEDVSTIKYEEPNYYIKGKKFHRIIEFYEINKKIPRPVIVDKNNYLLDGFNIIFFANEFGIKEIPVIRLENVEFRPRKREEN